MKGKRTLSEKDIRKIGIPVEDVIAEHMKDPEYRREYMVWGVRIELAGLVKYLRLESKLTQKQLAEKAGVPQPQIARLESLDDERVPGFEQIVRLLAALDQHVVLRTRPMKRSKVEPREVELV